MNQDELENIVKQVFDDEIQGLKQVLWQIDDNFYDTIKLIMACSGKVVVMGIGKSGHVANKLAATFASTGTPSFFVHPTEAMHGDLGMVTSVDIVIAISYSGNSGEFDVILPILKRRQVKIIAITGDVNSSIAKCADHVINIRVDKEACVLNLAPTTSTTATMVIGDALAVCLLKMRGFSQDDFALSHPGGALGRRLLMRVDDVMHNQHSGRLPFVYKHDNIKQVVFEMTQKGLGLTAVLDTDNQVVGVITDGDLRRHLDSIHNKAVPSDLTKQLAQDIMTKDPITLQIGELAVLALEIMEKHKITGFLVVNKANKLVGAFNLHDLLRVRLL